MESERRLANEIWALLENSNHLMNMAKMHYPCVMFYIHVALYGSPEDKKVFAGFLENQIKALEKSIQQGINEKLWEKIKEIEEKEKEKEKLVKIPFNDNIVSSMLAHTPAIYSMIGVFFPNMVELQKADLFIGIITSIIDLLERPIDIDPFMNDIFENDTYKHPYPFEYFAERLGFKFAKSNISNFIPRDISHLLLRVADIQPNMSVCFPIVELGMFWSDLFAYEEGATPCRFHLFEESKMRTTANLLTCLPQSSYKEIANFLYKQDELKEPTRLEKFLTVHDRFDEYIVSTHSDDKTMAFDRAIIPIPASASWYTDVEQVDFQDSFLGLVDWSKEYSKKVEWLYILGGMDLVRKNRGKVIALLPNNALYRRGFEESIRKRCVHDGYLDVVIALPKNIFPMTDAQTYILIFDLTKNKPEDIRDSVLFVDATQNYSPTKNINKLDSTHIDAIIESVTSREEGSDTCFRVPNTKILQNKANLTIGFYAPSNEHIESNPKDLEKIKLTIKKLTDELDEALDENKQLMDTFFQVLPSSRRQ